MRQHFSVAVIMTLCVGGLQSYATLFIQLKQVIEVRKRIELSKLNLKSPKKTSLEPIKVF
jgi:hypothetical protein